MVHFDNFFWFYRSDWTIIDSNQGETSINRVLKMSIHLHGILSLIFPDNPQLLIYCLESKDCDTTRVMETPKESSGNAPVEGPTDMPVGWTVFIFPE